MLAVDTNVVVANSGGADAVFCGMETICRCDSLERLGVERASLVAPKQ